MEKDGAEIENPRTAQSFCVPLASLAATDYDLSLNRYKEVEHEEVEHQDPKAIIAELRAIESQINDGLTQLEEMLG